MFGIDYCLPNQVCANVLNILCCIDESGYTSHWWTVCHCKHRSGLPADKSSWLHWVTKLAYNLSDLNPVDYSIQSALQQLVYHRKIKDTDHLKQVLNSGWDMFSQELFNGAVDQWSIWSVSHSSSWRTQCALYTLILWRLLVADSFLSSFALKQVAGIDVFEVLHLPATKQRIFNCNIQMSPFSYNRLISERLGENHVTRRLTVAQLW